MTAKDLPVVPTYVRNVCAVLRQAGAEAYVVGGGIRDALLGRQPKDWDVATDAPPDRVQQLFARTVPTGIRFGTVAVLTLDAEQTWRTVEVTTFRGDGDYGDGRRPDEVRFLGRIEDDLLRRDFTVNAIAYDPGSGVIVDPYGGRADLVLRRLRAVGNADTRFQEDGLRVMRGIRLATELEFHIEGETGSAMRRNRAVLGHVSRERIGEEWCRILLSAHPGRGLALLAKYEMLPWVLPSAEDAGANFCDEALEAVSAALDRTKLPDPVLRTAIVCYGLGRTKHHRRWLTHLVYPKRIRRDVLHLTMMWDRFVPASMPEDSDLRRFLRDVGRERIESFLSALRSWQPDEETASWIERADAVLQAGHPLHPGELALNGRDVQRIVPGVSGPAIGEWLERLLQHVLEHPEANTRAKLHDLLATWASEENSEAGRSTSEG